MMVRPVILLAGALMLPCFAAEPPAREIVKRAAAAAERDWKRAPEYSYCRREVVTKGGSTTVRTHAVLMLYGSPYYRLTSIDGHSLSRQQETAEEDRLRAETAARAAQPVAARDRRIADFLNRRKRDQMLIREIPEAFDFRITGERDVAGRRVWVLAAEPRPGYKPPVLQGRVLKGMRGTVWIDQQDYRWVKVEAEVFKTVPFGGIIAKVEPGTKILLEQSPAAPDLWTPSRFSMRVEASVLFWSRRSAKEETYWNYGLDPEPEALGCAAPPAELTR